jgi:hypothetical protein
MIHFGNPIVLIASLFGFISCFSLRMYLGDELLNMIIFGFIGSVTLGIVFKLFCVYIYSMQSTAKDTPKLEKV